MNWHVFKKDDPSTYPDIDCPMLVCWTNSDRYLLYNARWDNEVNKFMNSDFRWILFEKGDIFYSYIAYIPYIEKVLHPIKCDMKYKIGEHEDDGYCLCGNKCKGKCETTEYSLGLKRIWKDFE